MTDAPIVLDVEPDSTLTDASLDAIAALLIADAERNIDEDHSQPPNRVAASGDVANLLGRMRKLP